MQYLLAFVIGTVISWVTLIIVVTIAQRLADFSFPPWPEALWKLAVVATSGNVAAVILDPVHPFLGWGVGAIIFWILMVKWFNVDLFGAVIIVVVSWVVRAVLGVLLIWA